MHNYASISLFLIYYLLLGFIILLLLNENYLVF